MEQRIENLRAALASVEHRLSRVLGVGIAGVGIVPHPLRAELGQIRAACEGALAIDEQEAAKAER